MGIQKGERWLCQNDACGGEILVLASSQLQDVGNPRCSCGSVMKKPYIKPEIRISRMTEGAGNPTAIGIEEKELKRRPIP